MKFNHIAAATSTLTVALFCLSTSSARSASDSAVQLLGLTLGNQIVAFPANNPTNVRMLKVMGVNGKLVGIDQRPANGLLYGLSDKSKLYTINLETGMATQVSSLAQPLSTDAKISMDFNPVPDRLRVVDEQGNNFRINVDTGEVTTDKPLAYIPEDANTGKQPKVSAIAYTNAFAGPPSPAGVTPPTRTAQMFDLDTGLNLLAQQAPPNDGRLKTIGSLGLDLNSKVGFDIFSPQMGENTAFVATDSTLYTINLMTGNSSMVGKIGHGKMNLIDLAATALR
jgi:hypothetical protein